MNDNIFKEMRAQMNPDDKMRKDLSIRLAEEESQSETDPTDSPEPLVASHSATQKKRWFQTTRFIGTLATCLVLTTLAGILALAPFDSLNKSSNPSENMENLAESHPRSYTELYDAIASYFDSASSAQKSTTDQSLPSRDSGSQSILANERSAAASDSPFAPSPDTNNAAFSETNVQVSGIDEGDSVKTDGLSIYVISNQNVIILSAQGAESQELSRLQLPESSPGNTPTPLELFISKNVLVVLSNDYALSALAEDDSDEKLSETSRSMRMPNQESMTTATLYDVSDPRNPALVTQISQSGNYRAARLLDGLLYLISNHFVHSPDPDNPASYVPSLVTDKTTRLLPVEDIHMFPALESSGYAVVTAIDLTRGICLSQKSVLGGGDMLYMSHDNLYLASSEAKVDKSEPYQDSVYTIIDITTTTKTHLAKISLNQGSLALIAQATLTGGLLNQFSLDEYNGNLRIALTTSTSSMRELVDESHDVTSYQYLENTPTSNGVIVLDPDLSVRGSVEGLAENERIYSVRFSGNVGYVVTFRQVDPLFTLDLSDPAQPVVQGALKIPGFSTYMHPYSPGLLFGLGYESDGTRSGRVKLSMFDVSDPYNVIELSTLLLDSSYAEATYNHRAIMVDSLHNIIGFAVNKPNGSATYAIYGYSDESGFYQRADLNYGIGTETNRQGQDSLWPYQGTARGFYVGDNFYISSVSSLNVFALENFEKLADLKFKSRDK